MQFTVADNKNCQSQWGFIRVSYTLNMLMWHYINEERDDKSFMGVDTVSSHETPMHCFQNSGLRIATSNPE